MEPATAVLSDSILPAHGEAQQNIAFLARQFVETLAFGAHDESQSPAKVTIAFMVQRLTMRIEADDPNISLLEGVDGLRKICRRNVQVFGGASGGIHDGRCDLHRASQGDEDSVHARNLRRAQ